jgi:hypothetical protein
MTMSDPVLKLKILAHSEITLFRLQARRNATRMGLLVVALVFALLALAMLNFAAYQALAVKKGPAFAALMVALADVLLALILVAVSRGAGTSAEQEKLVRDIRDLAYKELSADVDEVKAGVAQVTEDVQRIRSGFSAFKSGSGGLTGNLSPIVSLLVGAVKKSRKK